MDVIPFPNAAKKTKKQEGQFLVEKINVAENSTLTGTHSFTCVDCGHIHSFEAKNIIFKALEFFCAKCGTLYKVSNPLLKVSPTRTPEPKTKRNRH